MNGLLKWILLLAAIAAALPACSRKEEIPAAVPAGIEHAGGENHRTTKEMLEGARAAMEMGKAVYERSCASCHDAGLEGAPKGGDQAAWSERSLPGTEHLVQNAVNGVGKMPARGGDPTLSEEKIRPTVHYIVELSR